MDTGLLSGTDADSLTVLDIAYGIGLGILQSDQCDLHIDQGTLRDLLVHSHDIGQQIAVDIQFVTPLLEGDAVYLLALDRSRLIGRIDLDDVVGAFFLLLQQFQCFIGVAGSDDTVGYLSLDQAGGIGIADIRQCNEVTEGGHSVCTTCSRISTCQGRKLSQIIHPVDLRQSITQRKSYRSTGRRHMFERSGCGKSCSFLQLFYQLPAVESIQEIDISGLAVQHGHRQITAVFHEDSGRLLVRVTSVF